MKKIETNSVHFLIVKYFTSHVRWKKGKNHVFNFKQRIPSSQM